MKHLHTLRRVNLRSKDKNVFMCSDPECNWTRRREFLLGKKFRCPYCGNEYLISQELLRLKTPHCNDCTTKPPVKNIVKIIPGLTELIEIQDFKENLDEGDL